ncbi:hypothetical protein JCM24511_06913 [Saitozyma sp. JCM 24511]|nr:hypothetical protein JCM24511_06913 [Saitozyma sp. JCM 24511]
MSRRTIDLTGVDRRLTVPPPSLRKTRHGDVHVYTDRPWRHEFFSQILNGTRGQRAGMSSEPERVSTWETGVRTWERVMQSMNELNIDATLGQSFLLPSDIGDDEEVILKLSSGTELSLAAAWFQDIITILQKRANLEELKRTNINIPKSKKPSNTDKMYLDWIDLAMNKTSIELAERTDATKNKGKAPATEQAE